MTKQSQETALKVPRVQEVRQELLPNRVDIEPYPIDDLERRANDYIQILTEVSPEDLEARDSRKASVENLGLKVQTEAIHQIQLLKEPIKNLSTRGQDGGEVANALINLRNEVQELDPAKFDFEPGWFTRNIGRLPFVGTPMKRYFSQFESAQTVISAIVQSLNHGRDELLRDNITLLEDQRQMRKMTQKFERVIKLGQLIDSKLQDKLSEMPVSEDPKDRFISEELIFPLRQRIIDLQQQLAVNQQGVLATEIIIRNNKELVRGVDRALSVTITALSVAATVALALAHQRIVLDKITAVNQTTAELIAGTSARLRTQGVEIQKRASSTQIDMNTLRGAFTDLRAALTDLSDYRMNALPEMAATVQELDRVTSEAERTIHEMERGNRRRPELSIEVA